MKIHPDQLTRKDRHMLMGSVVVPRPIALVSTVSHDGVLNLECRLTDIVAFRKPHISGEMIIGEVLRLHIKDDLYRDGIVDVAALNVIGRMGWAYYTRTRDLFEMKAPDTPENAIGKG